MCTQRFKTNKTCLYGACQLTQLYLNELMIVYAITLDLINISTVKQNIAKEEK